MITERLHTFSSAFRVERDETPKENYSRADIRDLFSNDPENYHYLLPKTGFDVPGQVAAFLNSKDESQTKTNRIEMDIKGFVREYIERQPVLHNPLQIKNRQVVSIGYGEVPMTSYTNREERKGMSYQEADIVSNFLPEAPDGTIFVSTSPKGESGANDFEGNAITHPETQTKIYYKKDGTLKAYTLRTDMELDESIRFMNSLADEEDLFDGDYESELDALSTITGTVIARVDLSPEMVLDKLREAKASDIAWTDKDRSVTFEQMYASLKDADRLSQSNEKVEKIIAKFERQSRKYRGRLNKRQIKSFSILIGKTVMEIHDELRGKSENSKNSASRMSELGGCAGGGSSEKVPTRIINGEVHYFVKKCPYCKREIEKFIKKGHKCKCGKVYEAVC